MIVFGTSRPITSAGTDWACLVRRGMLFSETESIEWWRLPPGATLEIAADHAVEEALLVLDGRLHLRLTGAPGADVDPGHLILLPAGTEGAAVATGPAPATALSVRGMPHEVSRLLPARVPELAARQPVTGPLAQPRVS